MTHAPSKTELDLSWPSLLEQLAGRCHTVRGAALARALTPLPSIAAAHQRQAEIVEARALQDHGEPLSFGGIYDVATALERSSKGGVLDPDELVELGSTLLGATRLRRHVLSRAGELPRLYAHASELAELPEVTGPIADSFDEGRKLKDSASPALGGLRQRVNHLLAELGRRTDGLLNEPHIGPYLMDRFVTQREDRYVVPVRADSRTRVRGIVHGTSSSGATVFVEPEEIIDLNNRLKLAQLEVAEEERRILAELSLRIQQAAPQIAQNLQLLALLDLIDGCARLAIDLRANPVALLDPASDAASVDLRNGRHPLMVLAGTQVVANDVALPSRGTLIISGPNAGGKTVSLKLTGLCVLMARVGLLLPVQEGSSLPWFDEVLTDVGDDQSLEKNLSTFSAHIHNLRRFLAAARPGTLVLLDEIAVGTDPEQGAALAQAVLEALAQAGATVLVTTHYDRLKALGATGAPFANASVGYDLVRLAPTYRLHLGIPGASSALPVAERLGLPAAIVARAQTLLSDAHSGLDRLLQTLSGERERSETARRAAEEHRAEAQRQSAQAAQLREEAQQALRRAQRQA
ncbi:MAG TPA: endonuclease MutS2, partial [Pseudomonadota bacterium]|nr:endonuclease MutS2 [Pseudomonadota bacterium]